MAADTVFYTTTEEKQSALAAANREGKRAVHDDHYVGPNGEHQLTFGASPGSRSPSAKELRLEQLRAKRQVRAMTIDDIMEYLELVEGRDA